MKSVLLQESNWQDKIIFTLSKLSEKVMVMVLKVIKPCQNQSIPARL